MAGFVAGATSLFRPCPAARFSPPVVGAVTVFAVLISLAPGGDGIIAGLVAAALVLVVYAASAGVLPRTLQRLLVSVPLLVLPLAEPAPLAMTTVLGWQLLYAAFWVILWAPPSWAGRIIAPAVVGLAAFCLDIGWVLLPLMLLRLTIRRDASAFVAAALLLAGSGWQRLSGEDGGPLGLAGGVGDVAAAIDDTRARWVTGAVPVTVAAIAAFVIVVLAVIRVTRPRWTLTVVAAAHAVVILVVTSAATAYYTGSAAEVTISMLLIVALVALTNPSGDLRLPMGAGVREVGPWLPVIGLALLLTVAWAVDLASSSEAAAPPGNPAAGITATRR